MFSSNLSPIKFIFLIALCFFLYSTKEITVTKYRCTPCGHDCDKQFFRKAGKCPSCTMPLVPSASIVFKNLQPDSVCSYIAAHPKTILLDVRTKEEFEGKADPDFGTLKNAVNIPVQELKGRMPELEKYKSNEIIVYCSHSHRSSEASYLLTQNGFRNIINMSGGMSVVPAGTCKK